MTAPRSKAEAHYAQIQKRDQSLKEHIDVAARLRADKSARLRQLRLAKEAEDAAQARAAKDITAASKRASKKRSTSSSTS